MDSDSDQKTGDDALEFTGERFTPECRREMYYEHWHRYAWVQPAVAGLKVLDAACGEGYGSALLAETASTVEGVDLSADAIEHARARYRRDNVCFTRADCTRLPFDDHHFDAVVSFETLEHLAEHDALLAEFRRVLKRSGFLILSSPDRKTYTDETGYVNEFHVRELYRDELESLVGRHFPAWHMWGQKLAFHSAIWDLEKSPAAGEVITADDSGAVNRSRAPELPPLYFLVAAAGEESALPDLSGLSLFGDRAESVYAHYNEEVRKHIQAGRLLAERDAEIARLKAGSAGWWRRLRRRLGRGD